MGTQYQSQLVGEVTGAEEEGLVHDSHVTGKAAEAGLVHDSHVTGEVVRVHCLLLMLRDPSLADCGIRSLAVASGHLHKSL